MWNEIYETGHGKTFHNADKIMLHASATTPTLPTSLSKLKRRTHVHNMSKKTHMNTQRVHICGILCCIFAHDVHMSNALLNTYLRMMYTNKIFFHADLNRLDSDGCRQ